MIKHVFLLAWASTTDQQRQQAQEEIETLRRLPTVRSLELGVDVGRTRLSYDLAVTVCLDDREALAAYEADPRHREVAGILRGLCDRVAIVDYEVPSS